VYEVGVKDWPAGALGRDGWLAELADHGWQLESPVPDPIVVEGQLFERFFFVRGVPYSASAQ